MEQSEEPQRADTSLLAGRRVLVVEDSPEDGERFVRWLRLAGMQVSEVVSTLEAARRALREEAWDAVVMDRLLADGDAFEWLCREHRERRRLGLPPCVLVSGHLDEKTYRKIYDMGAVPLPKHYLLHPDVLLAALGSALQLPISSMHDAAPDSVLNNPLLPRKP